MTLLLFTFHYGTHTLHITANKNLYNMNVVIDLKFSENIVLMSVFTDKSVIFCIMQIKSQDGYKDDCEE